MKIICEHGKERKIPTDKDKDRAKYFTESSLRQICNTVAESSRFPV